MLMLYHAVCSMDCTGTSRFTVRYHNYVIFLLIRGALCWYLSAHSHSTASGQLPLIFDSEIEYSNYSKRQCSFHYGHIASKHQNSKQQDTMQEVFYIFMTEMFSQVPVNTLVYH